MINQSSKFAGLSSNRGLALWLVLLFGFSDSGMAAEKQTLHGHVPNAVARLNLKPLGRLSGTNTMRLLIGLPLHNQEALTNLLNQLYDPASTNFHQYLIPAQFAERFGPTEADYQHVINFTKTNRFDISKTYGDRVLLEVSASVSSVESAFHVTMQTYQHPTEARQFFAPDVEPSVDADVPMLHISGLNNFSIPRPLGHPRQSPANGGRSGVSANGGGGSAPDGSSFIGNDFRNAYVPGVTLTGTGQSVGLVEFEGFFQSDITAYISTAGISVANPTVVEARQPGFTGPTASNTNGVGECSLDIETVMSMAPGLSSVVVFEESTAPQYYLGLAPIFSAMASSNQIKQFSTSWDVGVFNPSAEVYLMQIASQGQSFCAASGDSGAYVAGSGDTVWPDDDPYVTSVGGTELTMSGGSWVSETVFRDLYVSEGGVSGQFGFPLWQQGVNLSAVGGSTTMRNFPDVAMNGDNYWNNYDHTTSQATGYPWEGTSFSSPLWAGFTALLNQQLATGGHPTIGMMNPALYAIGKGSSYSSCFHDITMGNNTWSGSPNLYYAATGYDLCTGWGSMKGSGLITALTAYAGIANLVFVDFTYQGSIQNGAILTPFKTLAGGTNAVVSGGTIIFNHGGSSSETMKISKPMILNAVNGTATIGNGH